MNSSTPDDMRAALQALQIARADLDVALQLLPPPCEDTSIASQELTQVLDRVRTAKHHLEALEGVLAPHAHQ